MVFWSEMMFSVDSLLSIPGENGLKQLASIAAADSAKNIFSILNGLFNSILITEISFKFAPRKICIVLPEIFPPAYVKQCIAICGKYKAHSSP